uniref:Uncharacterized protein n=1 Tax=Rhizophagus irregularis (strain DAOM 181602 / DAOM 197198 / MUCL 43194) TaxID=747089 RepID=U9SI31_RHIID
MFHKSVRFYDLHWAWALTAEFGPNFKYIVTLKRTGSSTRQKWYIAWMLCGFYEKLSISR